jgi:hypothetical protein
MFGSLPGTRFDKVLREERLYLTDSLAGLEEQIYICIKCLEANL